MKPNSKIKDTNKGDKMNKKKVIQGLLLATLFLPINVNAETSESTTNVQNFEQSIDFQVESQSNEIKQTENTEITDSKKSVLETTESITEDSMIEIQVKSDNTINQLNLIKNGDFSSIESKSGKWTGSKAEDWNIWIPGDIKTTDYTLQVNIDKQLLFDSSTDEFRAAVTQKVQIDPDKLYELSFDIKTIHLTNIARIRINEQNAKGQTNLWHSKSVKGTSDWQTIKENFKPHPETEFITIELFYEKGTGTLYYDNLYFSEKENQETNRTQIEDKIEIHTKNIYVPKQKNYLYEITDATFAKEINGLLYPESVGETTVKISDEKGVFIKEIPLIIQHYEETIYQKMLKKWNDVIAGNDSFNVNNQVMVKQNEQLDSAVLEILSLYTDKKDSTELWKDISDYNVSANLTTSYRRVETIAKQVMQPASKYYQNQEIIHLAKDAMAWMYDNAYNDNLSIKGNWWDYEIGVPRAINNTLSLMQSYFTQEEIIRYTNPINYFVPDVYNFRVTTGSPFKALGGNLIDMGRVKIISGALRQDPEIVESAVVSLGQAFNYANAGEAGFYEDGSYIDHDNVALTGAYGNVLIDGLSQLLPVVVESQLLPMEKLENLYHFIDDAFLPLIHKGEMMDMTRGRAISRQELQSHAAGGEVIRGMMRIAATSQTDQKNHLNTIIKTLINQNNYYNIYQSLNSYKDIELMDQLLNNQSILTTTFPSRLTVFNEMDKISYQNVEKKFSFGLSMYSNTTQNYEYMNQENAHGWYTADGAIYLYNDDLSHYNDNYWATIDPYFIPGTTIIPGEREAGSGMTTLPSNFVGGTKLDEQTASAVMEFTNWDGNLTANKSWFIFNDKIVFLGSNIQTISGKSAITTIENRKNNENTQYETYINGEKVQVDKKHAQFDKVETLLFSSPNGQEMNLGYSFLEKPTLDYMNKVNQGSWQQVNAKQSDKQYENNFLTVYQTHSNDQTTYAYVLYPNISADRLTEKTKNETVKILQNDALVQSVYDEDEDSWGVILYEDKTYQVNDEIILTKKGIYAIKKEATKYIVSYFNPTDENYLPDTIKSDLVKETIQDATNKDKSTIIHLYMKDVTEDENTNQDEKTDGNKKEEVDGEADKKPNTEEELKKPHATKKTTKTEYLPQAGEVLAHPLVPLVGIALILFVFIIKKQSIKNRK
jgi:hyaluronate lyase